MSAAYGGGGGGAVAADMQMLEASAGRPPKGKRFDFTKVADEQAPPGVDKLIRGAAIRGYLDELLDVCQEWAGHPVIDAYDRNGWCALAIAAAQGHEACVRVLIAADADVTRASVSNKSQTALHYAARDGHASTCRVLLDEGASFAALNSDGKTPLDLAKARGHAECATILEAVKADEGASFAALNSDDKAPLDEAKARGHAECAAILEAVVAAAAAKAAAAQLERIEANRAYQATRAYSTPPVFPERDERYTTSDYGLVHLAMTITKRPIFHLISCLLLPHEAVLVLQCCKVLAVQVDQVAKGEFHRHLRALRYSRASLPSPFPTSNVRYWHHLQRLQLPEALAGRPPIGFRFAITKTANEQAPPGVDKLIFDAAKYGKLEELLGLCQQWAGHSVIDAFKDGKGWNALIWASYHGREPSVRVLIAAKADVAYACTTGSTALHYAAANGYASICRVLLDEGAPSTATNSDGKTSLELAQLKGKDKCVAVLA